MIISFAWTTPALLAGVKTVTRRGWTLEYGGRFHAGDLVDAWNRSPRTGRFKGAHKVATIRLTTDPHVEALGRMTEDDYRREGFEWLRANGFKATVDRIVADWTTNPNRAVWVVAFEVVEIVATP